jgi:hypothetical protein
MSEDPQYIGIDVSKSQLDKLYAPATSVGKSPTVRMGQRS